MKFKCSQQYYATLSRRQEKPIKNWIQIFAYAMQTKSIERQMNKVAAAQHRECIEKR